MPTESTPSVPGTNVNDTTPPVITPDIEELLADTGASVDSLGDTTSFSSRISSDVPIAVGERISLAVDTSKCHFFDPVSGLRIGARDS